MCGVHGSFGVYQQPSEIGSVGAAQRHRGPDATGVAFGSSWCLGNNRLAVTDPERGEQPYQLDKVVAVFNGEIYNHTELRAMLRGRGYRFTDDCDGSIIPALYYEFGLAFAELLDGMFAIAIVDMRQAPKLVLVTDDAGMKTLYYSWKPASGEFYFASEIPALLRFAAVSSDMWLPGLEDYLATKAPFGGQTMFADVLVLPPATTAVLTAIGGLRVSRRPRHTTALDADADLPALVHRELDQAVGALSQADVATAVITSGGLDSSYVTSLARPYFDDLHSFNIGYRGEWPSDERHFAREVASSVGSQHHQVDVDPAAIPELLPMVVRHLAQPNADPIAVSSFALFHAVRQAGFTVVLTGDASDEIFAGYDRLQRAVLAQGEWRDQYVESLAAISADRRALLYSPDYRDYVSTLRTSRDKLHDHLRQARPRLELLAEVETSLRLPAYHLRRVDHLSMAHGVEARMPFCQRNVVDLAAAIPATYKVDATGVKKVLYAAARGHVPASVLNRPKQPFTLPVTAMMHTGSALMTYAHDLLHPARIRARGLFNPRAIQHLLRLQESRPSDAAANSIWALLVFETWLDVARVTSVRVPAVPQVMEVAS